MRLAMPIFYHMPATNSCIRSPFRGCRSPQREVVEEPESKYAKYQVRGGMYTLVCYDRGATLRKGSMTRDHQTRSIEPDKTLPTTNMPRAAYLHVPFCAHRCGYCNFALVAGRLDLVPAYLEAVEAELAGRLQQPCEVDTLYYGGGTPTQLGPQAFSQLATITKRWHPLANAPSSSRPPSQNVTEANEWTVEANPADMTTEMAETLAQAGVNRLSLGGQSFGRAKLKLLERDHQATDIERSVHLARQYGMAVALDLIFATPGETLAEWHDDLRRVTDLAPEHVSVYGLTFEKGTMYWNRKLHGELVEADDELQRSMYLDAIDWLTAAGFEHYEVSNFAQPGGRSRHNETYWRGDEYFAAGPGAARYVAGVRETNHRSTTTYLRRVLAGESPVAESEALDAECDAGAIGIRPAATGGCRTERFSRTPASRSTS